MRSIGSRWVISAAAIAIVAWLLPGIRTGGGLHGVAAAFATAAALGLVNAIVRPVLTLLSCPLVLLTLGLFLFVINAAMLLLASALAGIFGFHFEVDGLGSAVAGSVLITIVTWGISLFMGGRDEEKSAD